MLPVNPSSKLKAADWVKTIQKSKAPNWMQRIFSAKGNDFIIAPKWDIKKTDKDTAGVPGWFNTWFNAASSVYMGSNWELSTGNLVMLPNDLSELKADGVSIGQITPATQLNAKQFNKLPQIKGHDTGEGGITVPTEATRTHLNTLSDSKLHYGGVVVDPSATQIAPVAKGQTAGAQEGALVIAITLTGPDGKSFPFNENEVTGTLFHELFHAGQIDQDLPNADADPRFYATTDAIKAFFGNP